MTSLLVVILLFVVLTFASYSTKRRFGSLGLALAAGALLSMHWAGTLTPFLEKQGVLLVMPPLSALVQVLLVLTPPFLLLFSGPTYTKQFGRIVGSLAFATLAITFLADILRVILVMEGPVVGLFEFLHANASILIVIGLICALIDVMLTRSSKGRDNKRSSAH